MAQHAVANVTNVTGSPDNASEGTFPNFCRLCLTENVQMVVPKDDRVCTTLSMKIKECLQISITLKELSRSLICKKCYESIEQLQQFRARCVRYNTYLKMRRSLDPDRSQPLRYGDNWYWYSCLGVDANSVYWGCSVVCCPAFIITYPSGKVCADFSVHQHKQKMEDVKLVYCNGEYVYDGYRYSFDMINTNRTLTFSCRSLQDPFKRCSALLITNDRSEVLTAGHHKHARETIIESAVKDGESGNKRSIVLIRGQHRELVLCEGFWYDTVPGQGNISFWNCIRPECTGTITMTSGVVVQHGFHSHGPVWLKWGARANKHSEPKAPMLMRVINPPSSYTSAKQTPPLSNVASPRARQNVFLPLAPISGIGRRLQVSEVISSSQDVGTFSVGTEEEIKVEETMLSTETLPAEAEFDACATGEEHIKAEPEDPDCTFTGVAVGQNSFAVTPSAIPTTQRMTTSVNSTQPVTVTSAAMVSKPPFANTTSQTNSALQGIVSVRTNHPIKIVRPVAKVDIAKVLKMTSSARPITQRVYQPRYRMIAPAPPNIAVPKIVHVMSLNVPSNNTSQPKKLPTAPPTLNQQPVPEPLVLKAVKTEPIDPDQMVGADDEAETITDEVVPARFKSVGADNPTRTPVRHTQSSVLRPMMLVASGSITSDNTLKVTSLDSEATVEAPMPVERHTGASLSEDTLSVEAEEDALYDLQDDEEIPPIIPFDADLPAKASTVTSLAKQIVNGNNNPSWKAAISAESASRSQAGSGSASSSQAGTRGISSTGNLRQDAANLVRAQTLGCAIPFVRYDVVVDPKQNTNNKLLPMMNQSVAAVKTKASEIQIHETTIKRIRTSSASPDVARRVRMTVVDVLPEPAEKDTASKDDDIVVAVEDPIGVSEASPDSLQGSADEVEELCAESPAAHSNTTEDSANHADEIVSTEPEPIETITFDSQPRQSMESKQAKPLSPTTQESVENASGKATTSKTVQLVKLQKSEQMLTFEGHLYKIKWSNQRFNYWDCMLREQVRCTAILETRGNDPRFWNKYGTHNHKVPKPIVNDENGGKYNMLSASSGVAHNARFPQQTTKIEDIQEQEGKMMFLKRRKVFNFKIRKENSKLLLYFANYVYEIRQLNDPGFRWKCIKCQSLLDTDEKFTIAKEILEKHNHEPRVTVIDLLLDDDPNNPQETDPSVPASKSKEFAVESEQPKTASEDPPTDVTKKKTLEDLNNDGLRKDLSPSFPEIAQVQLTEEQEPSDDEQEILDPLSGELTTKGEIKRRERRAMLLDNNEDDEEVVLDPLNGEFTTKGDIKRREHRAMLLGEDDEEDEDETMLDPCTGELRRKGDSKLPETEPMDEEPDETMDESSHDLPPEKLHTEDFEELLKGDRSESSETKKTKKIKRNSLASLKRELTLHNKLLKPDKARNFEVLRHTDQSSLIKYNGFTYELDKMDGEFSLWKCHLSPQYTCRGKVHLSEDCKHVAVSGVSHCHAATVQDILKAHDDQAEGEIEDTDQNITRKYTFYKKPQKNEYLIRLDDGFLYNCLTISKTGVSCWRCTSRQKDSCKAIVTMEGDFRSLTRNRFNHSHVPQASVDARGDEEDRTAEPDMDSPGSKRASSREKEGEKRKRKRQTM